MKRKTTSILVMAAITALILSSCGSKKIDEKTPEKKTESTATETTQSNEAAESTEVKTDTEDAVISEEVESSEEVEDTEAVGSTEEVQEEEEKVYTADVDSIKELATDLFAFDYEELSVVYDDEIDEAYVITYREKEIRDITTFVYENINRYIHFCQKAYTIDGIDRIRFDVKLMGQDQYGQDYEITGVEEIMTKETFDKFNWDSLEFMDIWDTFNDECYYFGVAPEIVQQVDTTKIFYTPRSKDGKVR